MPKNIITERPALIEIFGKHRGLVKQVAEQIGVRRNTVSMWLHGRSPSRRLDAEVPGVVARLLSKQKPRQNAA